MYSQFDQRKQFIVSWKKCIQQIDPDMVVKMIENLIPKLVIAKNDGLDSNSISIN